MIRHYCLHIGIFQRLNICPWFFFKYDTSTYFKHLYKFKSEKCVHIGIFQWLKTCLYDFFKYNTSAYFIHLYKFKPKTVLKYIKNWQETLKWYPPNIAIYVARVPLMSTKYYSKNKVSIKNFFTKCVQFGHIYWINSY